MLSRFKLQTQIMLLPMVAAAGYLLLLILNLVVGQHSVHLTSIEDGYLPGIEASRDLEETLQQVQQTLSDSVAAMDEEELVKADALSLHFQETLKASYGNPTQNTADLDELGSLFELYYKDARASTSSADRIRITPMICRASV